MKDMNIGVIGLGYVGKACLSFFEKNFNCYSYDINNSGSEISIKKLVEKVDIIFLCLPTPMKQNGECDISIVLNIGIKKTILMNTVIAIIMEIIKNIKINHVDIRLLIL